MGPEEVPVGELTRIEAEVATWDPEWQMLFWEGSGKRMSDGVPQGLADQQAFLELSRLRNDALRGGA